MHAYRNTAITVSLCLTIAACGAGFTQWNSRGVSLSVTDDGAVYFDISDRVVVESGCQSDPRCDHLLNLLDSELNRAGKCPHGYARPEVSAISGIVSITTQCKPAPQIPSGSPARRGQGR